MRKWIAGAGLLYVLYGLFFYWYLFMAGEPSVPEALKGTSADPATFMNERELMLTEEYSKIKDFLFFIRIPFEWFLFFILLIAGLSQENEELGGADVEEEKHSNHGICFCFVSDRHDRFFAA